MSETETNNAAASASGNEEKASDTQKPIDLQALAEKLLALLKETARLERERAGRSGDW